MFNEIIEVLEHSVKRNGEIVLTNKHLLNILKLAERRMIEREEWESIEDCRPEVENAGDR